MFEPTSNLHPPDLSEPVDPPETSPAAENAADSASNQASNALAEASPPLFPPAEEKPDSESVPPAVRQAHSLRPLRCKLIEREVQQRGNASLRVTRPFVDRAAFACLSGRTATGRERRTWATPRTKSFARNRARRRHSRAGGNPVFLLHNGKWRNYALCEKNKDVIFLQNEPEKLFRINKTP
jgi:hypothetical protein